MLFRSSEDDVRPMGREATGVRGVSLADGAEVNSLIILRDGPILTASENGYGKLTLAEEFPVHGRGGQGVIALQLSERNGRMMGALQVRTSDDLMMITRGGTLMRTGVDQISTLSRNTQGVRLVSFAVHWIRAEMHEFILRNWRIVKIATTKAQRKLFFNLRSMKSGLDTLGADEVNSMAKQLGVKAEEVVEMETRLSGKDVALEPLNDDGEDSFAPIAYLTDSRAAPDHIIENEQSAHLRSEGLEKALASLDPRSRRIVEARWLRENDQATLHDLAAEFGVSAERIRQIENKAMQKMRGIIGAAD